MPPGHLFCRGALPGLECTEPRKGPRSALYARDLMGRRRPSPPRQPRPATKGWDWRKPPKPSKPPGKKGRSRLLLPTVLLALTFSAVFGYDQTGHSATKTDVRFALAPRFAAFRGQPVTVAVRVVITDPSAEWCCLGQLVAWGDGSLSVKDDQDCDQEPHDVLMYSAKHDFKSTGRYTVTVILFQTLADGSRKPILMRQGQILLS